jgi:hypothetical protein
MWLFFSGADTKARISRDWLETQAYVLFHPVIYVVFTLMNMVVCLKWQVQVGFRVYNPVMDFLPVPKFNHVTLPESTILISRTAPSRSKTKPSQIRNHQGSHTGAVFAIVS